MLSRNMGKFYSNGENKNRLIDLTFDLMKEHASRSFSLLKCNAIFLSGDRICERIYKESIKFYQAITKRPTPMLYCMLYTHLFTIFNKENMFPSNFIELGRSWEISDNLRAGIEKFACHLYSSNKSSVDEKKQLSSKQDIDLSTLPLCQSTLTLNLISANYVVRL